MDELLKYLKLVKLRYLLDIMIGNTGGGIDLVMQDGVLISTMTDKKFKDGQTVTTNTLVRVDIANGTADIAGKRYQGRFEEGMDEATGEAFIKVYWKELGEAPPVIDPTKN